LVAVLFETAGQTYMKADADVLGARVHYLHAGSGRPMVLIHGLVGSSLIWRRNVAALAQQAGVYAIDLPNMGKSQRIPDLDATLEATADRVAAFMDAVGIEQADLVGHSHGGAVSLMLAARHPERVRSLILFAPANPYSHFKELLLRLYRTPLGRLVALAAPYVPLRLQLLTLGRMYGDPKRIAKGSLSGYTDGMRVPGTIRHMLNIVRGWSADMAALKAALPRVASVPTLLVWGDRDSTVDPASAMQLQRVLWNSELRIVRGGGHIVCEELPEESDRIMLDWMRRDLANGPLASGVELNSASRLPRGMRPASVPARAKTSVAI
jgi:pimeloyl-ACP methyl ester carboxylesterase